MADPKGGWCPRPPAVADTTLAWDRRAKMPLYARHGVREAWIVDLRARRIEVCREPGPEGYRRRSVHGPGEALQPLLLPVQCTGWPRFDR